MAENTVGLTALEITRSQPVFWHSDLGKVTSARGFPALSHKYGVLVNAGALHYYSLLVTLPNIEQDAPS